ncbi:dihydrodipicolinate synthase family protein [Caldimonas tepidiphila]|uniref:dihydrodipicolinate synthase family protein n=1 Tax=Caldimonas tepidiphila TaxID=2315841 RepID=UPI000E5B89E8|nr:dihydrodipicolinate synthase family protein [Caldimonas tepidiphila]
MKTTPVTAEDLSRSVIAVPPLARRRADLGIDEAANRTLIRHLEDGGVRSLMYGGNANLYHVPLAEYPRLLDFLEEAAGADTWVLPSAGPDYGKAMDQAAILRSRRFPTAMLLPMSFPYTDGGLAAGIRRFTDAMGRPAVIYLKSDNYIAPATLAALAEEGRVVSVKYAVVREDPAADPYLREVIAAVGAERVVSGIGERPAIVHLRDHGLRSFTSGSVCVAPRGSMAILRLAQQGRWDEAARLREAYLPLEDCRDGISPIRVLHDAVTLAGIADTGPMLPMLEGLGAAERERVQPVARALLAHDLALARQPQAA